MNLLCRLLGHKGDWAKATVSDGHWFSECQRCAASVVKDTKGSRWLPRVEFVQAFPDRRSR